MTLGDPWQDGTAIQGNRVPWEPYVRDALYHLDWWVWISGIGPPDAIRAEMGIDEEEP